MQPPTLSVNVYDSLLNGGQFRHRLNRPEGYTHMSQANGGFWSAQFSLSGDVMEADEWLEEGLMRHIVVFDEALGKCWEGFVNQVTVVYGTLTVARGPLLDVANNVALYYSTVDNTTIPPTVGLRALTPYATDTTSQTVYGIRRKILSTGGCVPADALVIRSTYLADNAYPAVTKTWASGEGSPPIVTVNCLGYAHWLDYPYNQTVATASVTTTAKILLILAANPNIAWLPFTTTGITTPAAPANVDHYENDYNLAWDLIMDCVNRGDTNQARWLFGVYGDLAASYVIAPTTAEYHQRLTDRAQRITTPVGTEVPPWSVLPGKWLLFPDLLVARAPTVSMQDDPRTMFIESVTYTAPNQLSLTGGRLDTLSQLLAQKGLSGVGG